MYHYRNNADAMLYTKQIVLTQLLTTDVNGDGVADFSLSPEYLTRQSLIPKFATSGNGKTIKLDKDAMTVLIANLGIVKTQLEEMALQTSQAIAENNDVKANISNRKQNLKDAIMTELENVSLVQAVSVIDTTFTSLNSLRSDLNSLQGYSSYDFKRKFDMWGDSGTYIWYSDNLGKDFWDYGTVSSKLDDMVSACSTLSGKISMYQLATNPQTSSTFYNKSSYTDVANEGAKLINSYEDIVEKTTQGLGNRSKFSDGIPDAVGEILAVVAQNLTTLIQCTQYLIDACQRVSDTLSSTDDGLATSITEMDMSGIAVPNVSIASSYDNFLKTSNVFDDKKVLQAFDDQVDQNAENLASQMSTSFTNYLSSVQSEIEAINTPLTDVMDALYSVTEQFPTNIYYKYKTTHIDDASASKIIDASKQIHYYGTVRGQISLADTIDRIYANTDGAGSIRYTDRQMTLAITTINTVYSMLGNFKDPFRMAMEDAFYGVDGLTGIVKLQKLIGEALIAMNARFSEFQSTLSSFSGVAVDALTDKVDETITTMTYVSTMIDDCFGDS